MTDPSLNIWVTRAEPEAATTADRLRALGHVPFVAPLLALSFLEAEVDLKGVDALAFTSANGVRAFSDASPDRNLRVFAVGDATARAAKAAGFKRVYSAEGDVNALAEGIISRARELKGAVLHPCALEPAGDLVGALSAAGLTARATPLYDTVACAPAEEVLQRLEATQVVLLHSPKAAAALSAVLKSHPAPHLRALCISAATAKPLGKAKLAELAHARLPMEAALFNLIRR